MFSCRKIHLKSNGSPSYFKRSGQNEVFVHQSPAAGKHRLTLRGFWVGSFLSFFLAIGAPYGNMIINGSFMALDISTPGAIFLFLFLIGALNLVLKLTARSLIGAGLFALLAGASWLAACGSLEALDPHSPGLIFAPLYC